MTGMNKKLRILAASLCLAGVGAAAAALPEPIAIALQRSGLSEDQVGIVVMAVNPGNGQRRPPLVSHRAEVPMQPASTMKLLTSAVAMERLNPNHRGYTELLSAARIEGEVLQGDLVLRGGADPELGWPQLMALMAELRWRGIREIAGDVILDRSLFRPARADLGRPPFDEAGEFPYNVIPDALQLAGNLLTLEMISGERTMALRILPPLERVEVINNLELVDGKCDDWDDLGWKTPRTTREDGVVRIELHGKYPKLCTQRPQLQLVDRSDLADRLIRYAWSNLGGSWRGQARDGVAPDGVQLLARRESRPWGEVLRVINKRSDNPLTRLLYLSLGVQAQGSDRQTPTAELASREVKRWLADKGIAADGLVVENGSGLSRKEMITPLQLARAIQAGLQGPYGPELLMSMPLAGVDGGFRERFKGAAAGRARLKPGGLRNVGAMAGQVLDAAGTPHVMVVIVNADVPRRGRPVIDAVVDWIATSRLR